MDKPWWIRKSGFNSVHFSIRTQTNQELTSFKIWKKWEEIYQSKGPVCKASLLKSLIQHKMPDSYPGACIRDHLWKFFDILNRLSEMDIKIDEDLRNVMLLYILSSNFEIFLCAVESQDVLLKPKALWIKIVDESDAHRHDDRQISTRKLWCLIFLKRNLREIIKINQKLIKQKDNYFLKITCFKCKCTGHYAAQRDNYKKNFLNYKQNNFGLFTSANDSTQTLTISKEKMENLLHIDTGCVGHSCNNDSRFVNLH